MVNKSYNINKSEYLRQFIKTWIPLMLVLITVFWILDKKEQNSTLTNTKYNAEQLTRIAQKNIFKEQEILKGDVLFLSKQSSLQNFLSSESSLTKKKLASDLLNFTLHRQLYDQVRFINIKGEEIVRINWNNANAYIVAEKQLQDKSDRYYIQESLLLNKDDIYFSPFDLNIDNNKIEKPYKPVIRVATPVFDKQGNKRGVIVLNYLGNRILDHLLQKNNQDIGGLWLLNSKGYWLRGPEPGVEWAFMYPQKLSVSFAVEYAREWNIIQSGSNYAQILNKDGLLTYIKFEPRKHIFGRDTQYWTLVSFVPSTSLGIILTKARNNLSSVFFILTFLLIIVSSMLAYNKIRRLKSEVITRDNEARFRGLLESAADAIVIIDHNGLINLVNSQTEKWFGYSRDELTGQPVEILIPARFHNQHVIDRSHYIVNPSARPMGAETDLFGLRKNGEEFPVEISLSPLQTDSGILITSIIRDISARKLIEQSKKQLEVRYQELIYNLPVGVYRNTPGTNGHFLEVNPAMLEIFEADSYEELLSHSVSDLYCNPLERELFSEKITMQGFVKAEELHLKTLRGREFYAAITAAMKKDNNKYIYFDGIVEDITERKNRALEIQKLNKTLHNRSVELEAINLELESFSYSVSHDLRAPLRAIDGFSHMLLNNYADRLDKKGLDRLKRVRSSAQRMALLIDDLIKLSRISRTDIKREKVDLSSTASAVINELHQSDPIRQVQFNVDKDLTIDADARFVRVIMDNLIGNAWKFTSNKEIATIDVGQLSDTKIPTFFVKDNGAGFDMNYAEKLFGAFQRLHDNSEFPGTGIGLATVQRVINKHGGRIWAESTTSNGAIFYFTVNAGSE